MYFSYTAYWPEGHAFRVRCSGKGPGYYRLDGVRLPDSIATVLDFAILRSCNSRSAALYVHHILEALPYNIYPSSTPQDSGILGSLYSLACAVRAQFEWED